ncbi:MAG: hypothetical protein IJE46_06710 [Clostridia bacterium]|nr:hypothetical protein [Clostridia bacterium]
MGKCKEVLGVKASEYATSDRLHNFKVAAVLQQESPIKALGGMMAKHTVSVYDLIKAENRGEDVSIELWDEKIGDHINYLLLLWAAVIENKTTEAALRGEKVG